MNSLLYADLDEVSRAEARRAIIAQVKSTQCLCSAGKLPTMWFCDQCKQMLIGARLENDLIWELRHRRAVAKYGGEYDYVGYDRLADCVIALRSGRWNGLPHRKPRED